MRSPTPWEFQMHELQIGFSCAVYDATGVPLDLGHLDEEDLRIISAVHDLLSAARTAAAMIDAQAYPGVVAKLQIAVAKAEGRE